MFEDTKEGQILKLIYSVSHKCIVLCENESKKYGISFPQLVILSMLNKNQDKDICQKDLENKLGVKGSSISSLLSNMIKKNFIVKEASACDGRKYIVKLTDKSLDLINKIEYESTKYNFNIFNELTEEEKDQLIKILLKIE